MARDFFYANNRQFFQYFERGEPGRDPDAAEDGGSADAAGSDPVAGATVTTGSDPDQVTLPWWAERFSGNERFQRWLDRLNNRDTDNNPSDDDGDAPTDGGGTPPADDGDTPPDGGGTPPAADGDTPSDGGDTPPADNGDTPTDGRDYTPRRRRWHAPRR